MIKRPVETTAWAIAGQWADGGRFLYYGTHPTRKEAIRAHTEAKGRTWLQCRKDRDRCVRVTVKEIEP